MNVLYGIQGTGHGHISRAKELLPELCKHANADVLISGYACQLDLQQQDVTYRKRGISLKYNRSGGVSILETLKQFKPIRFLTDIQSIPLQKYDLVISDYEPVSSWAARVSGVRNIALSHQAAFLSSKTPRPPKRSVVAEMLLQQFAPTESAVGFHFQRYDDFIKPPIIREEVQELKPAEENYITVYLPAWSPTALTRFFHKFPRVDWQVFSPECIRPQQLKNVWLRPVSHKPFLKSIERCKGVMTSAGFEMCAEAMFLHKKLIAIPIQNQYEQQCNAAALKKMGITTLSTLNYQENAIWDWLEGDKKVHLKEIADPAAIVKEVLAGTTNTTTTQPNSAPGLANQYS